MLVLDHVAVAGSSLEEAVAVVEEALGVPMSPGGIHDRFGTWNRLLGLADGLYVEAIAINPKASQPAAPRPFDLDRFSGPARVTNWICRTDDLSSALASMSVNAGVAVSVTRGALRWQMSVPDDGVLPFDNLFPALIEWQCDQHPSDMLPDTDCTLRRLVVSHPEAGAIQSALALQLRDARVVFETGEPGLMAEIDTPHGRRTLR